MSAKNLDVHSWPLIILSVAALTLSVSWVASLRDSLTLEAMTRPALKVAQTGNGLATVSPNTPEAPEPPGLANEIPSDPGGMAQSSQLGRSLVLQMAVDQAVIKAAQPVYINKTSR